jgi:hypothetical protein
MRNAHRSDQGIAMVAILIVMVLLMGIGAALHVGVIGETALRGAHARAVSGFYAAEAGINRGMGEYRNIFLSYSTPGAADFAQKSFMLGPRKVSYQMSQVAANLSFQVPAGQPFAGLNSIRNVYIATAGSQLTVGDTEASLGTEFDVDLVPLFQFLAFYAGTLEILPGPTMTLNGPIHTNGDLYLNSNNTLTIAESVQVPTVSVTAAGMVFRGRKDQVACTGTVTIATLKDANKDGVLDRKDLACTGSKTDAQLAPWLGALRARQPTVAVPQPSITARGGGGLYWQNADLRIVLNLSKTDAEIHPIEVQRVDGTVDPVANASLQAFMVANPGAVFYNDVPRAGNDQNTACNNANSFCNVLNYPGVTGLPHAAVVLPTADYSVAYPCGRTNMVPAPFINCTRTVANEVMPVLGGVTARRGGFYNNRELAWVYMLNVNMHDLLVWNRTGPLPGQLFDPNDQSDGGPVVFLSVQGPTSVGPLAKPRYGVRVYGSSNLDFPAAVDPTGLTVVSDQAVFVEGNYNTGTAARPWMPAALIGDTINVLSANWSGNTTLCRNDCQSRRALANRPAVSTAVNAAFIGGVDTTTVGNYNGGFENYPRFHETWTNQTLTYLGSFVSLGNAQRNNGAWCGTGGGCNIYDPPARAWNFEPRFMQAQNLPPMTPQVVSVNQILFTENFR